MRATVFAIGGAWKRSPLYEASPESLRSLQRQGWSIEAHASAPHSGIETARQATSPTSARAARWTAGSRRSASSATAPRSSTATRARPPRRSRNRPVVAFAWPFGAYGADTRTNDPRVAGINLAEARRVYSLGFNEDGQSTFGLLTQADRSHAHRALRDRPHPHAASALRAARARDRGVRTGGLACVVATRSRAKWHSRACATWRPRALVSGRHRAPRHGAAAPAGGTPAARGRRRPDRARADGDAPDLGRARLALGASLVDRAAVARVARRCSPAGASPTTPPIRSRPGLTQRGARLVPVLADPAAARRRPARRTGPCGAGWRCGSASRCVRSDARGIVLDWRDLPPRARASTRVFLHELRVELGAARADRRDRAAGAHACVACARAPTTCARSRGPRGCSCSRGTSTARAASPGRSRRSRSGSRRCARCCAPRRARAC